MIVQDDPAELERAFEADARRRRRTTKLVFFGFVGLMILPFAWYALQLWLRSKEADAIRAAAQLTPEERAAAVDLLPKAERVLAEATEGFRTSHTAAALAQVTESEDVCPYPLRPPTEGAAKSYVLHGSIDGNYFGSIRYTLSEPGAAITDSSELRSREYTLQSMRKTLDSGKAEKQDLHELRQMMTEEDTSIIVVVQSQTPPLVTGDGPGITYSSGRILGTAYLYSFAQKRIVCAGQIDAENSPKLDIRYSHMKDNFLDESIKRQQSAKASLERDLEVQVRRAIAASLHAVSKPSPS